MKKFIDHLEGECRAKGFPLVGLFDADSDFLSAYSAHVQRFKKWIEAGHQGEMDYLKRGVQRRLDPWNVYPDLKSFLVVGKPYRRALRQKNAPQYASYLNGNDYHQEISKRLTEIMTQAAGHYPDLKWKVCVDTSAVLERALGELAGIGWIGKNTLLIHPQYGSYFFIGVVFLNQKINRKIHPHPNYCGQCERCLQRCPTRAFVSPHVLDARKCISYLTLEKRAPFSSEKEGEKIGEWIAGCDLCQEACPFNRKAEVEEEEGGSWEKLLIESLEEYQKRVKNSALKRVKPHQFKRNLAYAFRNHLRKNSAQDPKLMDLISHQMSQEQDSSLREVWVDCRELISQELNRTPNRETGKRSAVGNLKVT